MVSILPLAISGRTWSKPIGASFRVGWAKKTSLLPMSRKQIEIIFFTIFYLINYFRIESWVQKLFE